VDGTINRDGTITRYCNLWVQRGEHEEHQGFYVANLGRDHIILGYPWFKLYNPTFDWQHNTLRCYVFLTLTVLIMDYHWDRHPYFVIIPTLCTDYDSLLLPIVTHY
jgi:hypothetical protein